MPRKIDMLSLMSMSDAFFGRIFHVRGELVPFGTVSMTTYFHVDADDLAAEDTTRVLGVADANDLPQELSATRTANCGRRAGACWRPRTQIAYFKA